MIDGRVRDDTDLELSQLRAHVAALEQLLEVYESTVSEQSGRLEKALQQLDAQANELKRSNQELELFAYVASHDLQEPLRMVSSYTQLLASRYRERLDGDALEFIDYAVDGARRMQSMIDALLQYSRVSNRPPNYDRVDLNQTLVAVRGNLALALHDSEASLEVAPLPTVRADHAQLLQLFQNLVANAIKFRGEKPPRIEVSSSEDGGQHRITVRDHGIGIEPRFADRIFQIFQRLHSREEYPGTGIGLAICKKIVERHGGRIWVESKLTEGSAFHVTLPRNENEVAA